MTREEALVQLRLGPGINEDVSEEYNEAVNMAVEALQPQPKERTKERTETHECDCISREEVLDALHSCFAEGFNEDRWWNSTYVLDVINKVPSIQPQPKEEPQHKTGHWIEHKHGGIEHIECSECGVWFLKANLPRNSHCPNCGSRNHWEWELKMQEEKK